MACFFSGSEFVRNFLILSECRASFRKLRIEKINLPQLFSLLCALMFSPIFAATAEAGYYVNPKLGCFATKPEALNAYFFYENPDSFSSPTTTYYRDVCTDTGSGANCSGHLVSNTTGNRVNFTWSVSYGSCTDVFTKAKNNGAAQCKVGVGNPCNAAVGNKYSQEVDYVGNGPNPLIFERIYNSNGAVISARMGTNWRHSFERSILASSNGGLTVATVYRADGKNYYFTLTGGMWIPDADIDDRLVQTTSGWIYYLRDGTQESYDTSGQLLAVTYLKGTGYVLTYTTQGLLATLTDSFGRTISIGYDGSKRVTSVTTFSGQLIGYGYDANNNLTRATYPDGTAKIYHYENSSFRNHLTGISYVEANGTTSRYATYAYNANGKAISTVHTGGFERFTLNYDSDTQTTVTDAAATRQVMSFATTLGIKNLVSNVNQADGKTFTQTFDARNNLTCKQDEEGHVTTYTYNASNQKQSRTEGQSGTCSAPVPTAATRTTTYQYLSADLDLPTLIEGSSVYAGSMRRVTIDYDAQRNPTVMTQSGYTPSGAAVSRSVTLSYNTFGQFTSINGPRTDVADITTLTYYECTAGGGCGQLKSVANALGHTTTYDSYDANGRVTQTTAPNGVVSRYSYDARSRVTSIVQTPPNGVARTTQYSYNAAGNVTSTTLPTGLSLTYTYDAALNLRRVTDSLGNYIDYGYDLKGNRTQTYTYDASGTLVRTVDLAFDARNRVSQINAGGSITQKISDAVGNLTKVTDPNTVAISGTTATNNSYDALNRLFQTVDRLSGSTNYGYDANDRLKTVQAPNGASTQYQYDDLGNLLQETSPDRGTLRYAYDAAGNLVQQIDARGIVSAYAYDALNRLTRIDYGSSVENVIYTYDSGTDCSFGLGRLCSVVDESGSTVYGYDAFGNLLAQTHAELGIAYTTRYTYDAGNRIASITYPDSRVVTYQRDVLGRITSVDTVVNSTAVTIASARSFRPDGLLLSQSFGNGLNELRQYDTQGRLTYQSLASADTRLYAYDANGNLKGLQSLPLVSSYNYDALDRLSLDQRTTTATTSSAFTFDANGNRLSENTGTYAYLANSNRLQSTPQGSITLDAAGNTLGDGARSYTYNNAGHLSTVAGASYSYNAQRLRSRKIMGSQGTVYHYDLSGNLIAESDTAGVMRRSYVWADGQPLAQIEPVTTLPPDNIQEVVHYLHTDHLNTPRLATNSQAQVIWRWEGNAFGETLANEDVDGDGKLTTINLRFPGQYYDAESGLHYNWNRYYDPKLGRYVTSDPIGLRGGIDTYLYVRANPLRYKDPRGLSGQFPGDQGSISGLPGFPASGGDQVDPILGLPIHPVAPPTRGIEALIKCVLASIIGSAPSDVVIEKGAEAIGDRISQDAGKVARVCAKRINLLSGAKDVYDCYQETMGE